jgi:hypothetical protein
VRPQKQLLSAVDEAFCTIINTDKSKPQACTMAGKPENISKFTACTIRHQPADRPKMAPGMPRVFAAARRLLRLSRPAVATP